MGKPNIETAIEDLRKEYEKALGQDHVTNPVLYALYNTFRKYDRRKAGWMYRD